MYVRLFLNSTGIKAKILDICKVSKEWFETGQGEMFLPENQSMSMNNEEYYLKRIKDLESLLAKWEKANERLEKEKDEIKDRLERDKDDLRAERDRWRKQFEELKAEQSKKRDQHIEDGGRTVPARRD